MKYYLNQLGFLLVMLLAVQVNAEPEKEKSPECPAAVDVADSMNVNHSGCDYSNEGLNGFFHRAFKNNSKNDGAPPENTTSGFETTSHEKLNASDQQIDIVLKSEMTAWGDAQSVRSALLSKAMSICKHGFVITQEAYKLLLSQKIELNLEIQCEQ